MKKGVFYDVKIDLRVLIIYNAFTSMFYRRSKAKIFSFIMPLCLPFACSNKSGKLNETKNFFKVPPDPKNNRDSCSCTTLVMPNGI